MKRPIYYKVCKGCLKQFEFKAFKTEVKHRIYCTRSCANKNTAEQNSLSKTGKNNPMFGKRPNNFLGRKISSDGYWLVFDEERKGYIREHRLIIEKHLGRKLDRYEVVHHKDFNKKNNNIKNLILLKNESEHRKYHKHWRRAK